MAKFVIFKSKRTGGYYWHLKAKNGEIVAQSEGYFSRWTASRGVKRFKKLAASAEIVKG